MRPLPPPDVIAKETVAAIVARHPSLTEDERHTITQFFDRAVTMRDRAICSSLQQEMGGQMKNFEALRRAIEEMLYPKS